MIDRWGSLNNIVDITYWLWNISLGKVRWRRLHLTSQVTRTAVAYGSRNQNNDCSCGNRLRSLESVVNMNSAGRFSRNTALRVLLFKQALLKGKCSSNPFLTVGHKSLTSSTEKVLMVKQLDGNLTWGQWHIRLLNRHI